MTYTAKNMEIIIETERDIEAETATEISTEKM